MYLSTLLREAELKVRQIRGDAEISEICFDSRRARGGACFVAVSGSGDDGHKYIPSAIAGGCSSVVAQDASGIPADIPFAIVDNTRAAVAMLAQTIRGWPSRKLVNVGITGTNGKSTTACLVRDILAATGHMPGLLGTITYQTGSTIVEANQTTPDPVALADMMAEMVAGGRTHLVMETSSHALDQDRTAGIDFRVAVFSNLTGDHLDYHKTMEAYLLAKARLFEQLSADAHAVINQDDKAGPRLAKMTRAQTIMYGLSESADLQARLIHMDASGTRFELAYRRAAQQAIVNSPMIGRHNVYNFLAAAGACLGLGIDIEKVAAALGNVAAVPGRLERVPVQAPYSVFVDYAHTDDALVNVLGALRPVTKGRILLVFGCGGDRDRSKRARMAKVAQQMADMVFVTSDNPRTEQPQAIIDEIVAGFEKKAAPGICVEIDRRQAISQAIGQACDGDIVLIAGKGHEKYQIIGREKHHFDDVEVSREFMLSRGGQP